MLYSNYRAILYNKIQKIPFFLYFVIIQTDIEAMRIFYLSLLYSFYLSAGSGVDKVGSFLRSTTKSASKWAFLTHFFILFFIDDYLQKSVYL